MPPSLYLQKHRKKLNWTEQSDSIDLINGLLSFERQIITRFRTAASILVIIIFNV